MMGVAQQRCSEENSRLWPKFSNVRGPTVLTIETHFLLPFQDTRAASTCSAARCSLALSVKETYNEIY